MKTNSIIYQSSISSVIQMLKEDIMKCFVTQKHGPSQRWKAKDLSWVQLETWDANGLEVLRFLWLFVWFHVNKPGKSPPTNDGAC